MCFFCKFLLMLKDLKVKVAYIPVKKENMQNVAEHVFSTCPLHKIECSRDYELFCFLFYFSIFCTTTTLISLINWPHILFFFEKFFPPIWLFSVICHLSCFLHNNFFRKNPTYKPISTFISFWTFFLPICYYHQHAF